MDESTLIWCLVEMNMNFIFINLTFTIDVRGQNDYFNYEILIGQLFWRLPYFLYYEAYL